MPIAVSTPATTSLDPAASAANLVASLKRAKRQVVTSSKAKENLLKNGEATNLVALLRSAVDSPSDDSLTLSAEAASVVAALSLPNLTAISILLSADAHQAVVLSLSHALRTVSTNPNLPPANRHKLLESHLRALKSLYSDLVKVVGPREWGSDVVGASIDVEERRDAEGLWAQPQKAPAAGNGKGKEREGDVSMSGAGGADGVDLDELKKQAQAALDLVFNQRSAATSAAPSSAGSSSSPQPFLLSALIDLLAECAQDAQTPTASTANRLRLADLVCAFLAGVVRLPKQREAVTDGAQGRKALLALKELVRHGSDKVRENALKALAVLIRDSPSAFQATCNFPAASYRACLDPFFDYTVSPVPSVRLAACTLVAVVQRLPAWMYDETFGLDDVTPVALALLGLIEKEPELRANAAFVLAFLVADHPALQVNVIAGRAFQIFFTVLSQPLLLDQPYPTPAAVEADARMREGIFLAIASLSASEEAHRRAVLDHALLPLLLSGLSHPVVGVRAAACHAVRALSRSVNILRTDLVEAHAEEPLVRLLREEENEVVKITASAAVANLLLEFSPLRPVLIDAGCIPRMCQLALKSPNATLQLNALWAIRNATFASTTEFKRTLLQSLTWDGLFSLLTSPSPTLPIQALGILRNITCPSLGESITGLGADEAGEERLLGALEELVAGGGGGVGREREREAVVEQALYCLNNIAVAGEAAQLAIAARTTLLRYILSYLDSRVATLRVAALWSLHNLIYRRGASSSSAALSSSSSSSSAPRRPHEIVDKLRALGLEGKLRMLERDPALDVRERVKDLQEAMA